MTASEELASLRARLDLALAERDGLIATMFATDELLDAAEEILLLVDDEGEATDEAFARLRAATQQARERLLSDGRRDLLQRFDAWVERRGRYEDRELWRVVREALSR
ncbi:MAG: hypothetical protein KF894_08915 [Labilithrix sp.]|nr:hypothetical protein [Labilithrix sp.]